jgi:hypothetical protein
MTTMKMKTFRKHTLVCGLVALVFAAQAACAQQGTAGSQSLAFAHQSFPAALVRYEARLFELTEPGEKKYDAGFAGLLRALVAPQTAKNAKFLARLTSGPTDVGSYFATGQRGYVYYGICQVHQCDTTTMDILFDPVSKRMVGKLLDRCVPQWLGQPDNAEMALLDQRHRASYPATATACAGNK